MKKIVIYGVLLIAALLVPTEASELGKLKPVETIAIYQEAGELVIETDTKDVGRGVTAVKAIENLKETSSGTIYLDTADYLLVMQGGEPFIRHVSGFLKKSVRICSAESDVEVDKAASFLSVHTPRLKLKDYKNGAKLQTLRIKNGRLYLEDIFSEKSEKSA